MRTWKVIAISNAHGTVYQSGPWNSVLIVFHEDAITVSCMQSRDGLSTLRAEYQATRLGHDHYEVGMPEASRCELLADFAFDRSFDRSWVVAGEPEIWRLSLGDDFYPACSKGTQVIHLALR